MSARVFESADSAARISASLMTASCNSSTCVANVSHAARQCANLIIRLRHMAASDAHRGGIDTGTIYHSLEHQMQARPWGLAPTALVYSPSQLAGRDKGHQRQGLNASPRPSAGTYLGTQPPFFLIFLRPCCTQSLGLRK